MQVLLKVFILFIKLDKNDKYLNTNIPTSVFPIILYCSFPFIDLPTGLTIKKYSFDAE